jgi:proteasome lid subunit RPN8/RPN11
VTVAVLAHRGEAEITRLRLEADGIAARVVADDEGGLSPGFFRDHRVRVVVAASDLADAVRSLGSGDMLVVPAQIAKAIEMHAVFTAPLEACGLLAFDATGSMRMAYCLSNADRSPRRFTVHPAEHFGALRHAERHGWEIAGAFHSHPAAEARPSPTDVAGALDPTWVHLIVGPLDAPRLRAYRISAGAVEELVVQVR